MKKKYKIAGVYFYQEELLFGDNEKVREVLREANINISSSIDQRIGEVLEALYERKLLQKIIPVILKRDDSNFVYRYLNNRRLKAMGISSEEIVTKMKDTEIVRVMLDFFIFRSLWIQNLASLNLSWRYGKAILSQVLSRIGRKKKSTPLQGVTS